MPLSVIYFDEYYCQNSVGDTFHPMVDFSGNWTINGDKTTLTEIIKLCNIPEDEALMLKLRYGG
jgi:hypothetical protein